MTESSEQPLKPADFNPRSTAPTVAATATRGRYPRGLLIGIGGAGILLLFVVFVLLPGWVSEDTATPAAPITTPDNGQLSDSNTGGGVKDAGNPATASPFADAQESKARRAAQEALQLILELQETLEARGVEVWGAEAFAAALAEATAGDQAYRERDFDIALAAYARASDALMTLETSIPERIEQATAATVAAIESGDQSAADANLAVVTALDPTASTTQELQARVTAIAAVQQRLEEAEAAARREQFQAAIALVREAINLDPANRSAQQRLEALQGAARDARFLQAMSDGYLALEQNRFAAAEKFFNAALGERSSAPEPKAALLELDAARTAARLRQLQLQGQEQEAAEAWTRAQETYREALGIDSSVVFASEGLARSEPRAELDAALEAVVKERERLLDAKVLANAEATLARARAVPDPGEKLQQQIETVSQVLEYARTPVTLSLVSDNQTDVTILRVRRLGTFVQTTVTLRPGSYTAVGIRNGFRDVRVTFEVKPGASSAPIAVRCTEAI